MLLEKTKLFYQYVGSGESLTRDSEVQVIAIKGYKAAVYSPIKLSNIINKSDNQIIKLAKEADKDNAQKIQIASENKIKTGFLNAPDQPDSTKELVKKMLIRNMLTLNSINTRFLQKITVRIKT